MGFDRGSTLGDRGVLNTEPNSNSLLSLSLVIYKDDFDEMVTRKTCG